MRKRQVPRLLGRHGDLVARDDTHNEDTCNERGTGPAYRRWLIAVSRQLSALSYQPTRVCGSCPAFVAGVFVVGVIPSDKVAVATEESRDLPFSHLHHRPRSCADPKQAVHPESGASRRIPIFPT